MTRLVVTEKERMALNIANALGTYSKRSLGYPSGRRGRLSVYEVAGAPGSEPLTVLPLSGHIMNYVTRSDLERWSYASVDRILKDPQSLVKVVSRRGYYSAIRSLAEKSSEVVIATDSDEEGENIGLEVIEALGGQMKPVRRLWLTTTVPSDIRSSISRTREFNRNLALSVEARRKIDALVGFAGTRQITLRLRRSLAKSQRSTHSSWGGRSTWWRRRGRQG